MTDDLYKQPEIVEKRPRYFDGQYLSVDDFVNEQQYHIDRQRRVSRFLQVSGVLDGLEVEAAGDQLQVSKGSAIDSKGRQIILNSAAVSGQRAAGSGAEQAISISDDQFVVSLAGLNNSQIYKLFIAWDEVGTDTPSIETGGSQENTRFHERPRVYLSTDEADLDGVLLAEVKQENQAWTVDLQNRQYSGLQLPASDGSGVTLRSLNGASNHAQLSSSLTIQGSLKVAQDLIVAGHLKVGESTDDPYQAVVALELAGHDTTAQPSAGRQGRHAYLVARANNFNAYATDLGFRVRKDATWQYDSIVDALTIRYDGNVGIGATNPSIKLAIGTNNTGIDLQNNNELAILAGGNERVKIDQIGNIGIGGTDASSKLYVNQSGNGKTAFFEGGSGVEIKAANPLLKLSATDGNKSTVQLRESIQGKGGVDLVYDGNNDYFHIEGIIDNASAGKHLSIHKTTGNVGIGTQTPIAALDIASVARTNLQSHPQATSDNPRPVKGLYVTGNFGVDSDGIEFRHTNGAQGIGFGTNTIYAAGSSVDQDLNIQAKGNGKIALKVDGNEYLRINSSGSLFVQNEIECNTFCMTPSDYPVFAKVIFFPKLEISELNLSNAQYLSQLLTSRRDYFMNQANESTRNQNIKPNELRNENFQFERGENYRYTVDNIRRVNDPGNLRIVDQSSFSKSLTSDAAGGQPYISISWDWIKLKWNTEFFYVTETREHNSSDRGERITNTTPEKRELKELETTVNNVFLQVPVNVENIQLGWIIKKILFKE
jgi:hypothetical protein